MSNECDSRCAKCVFHGRIGHMMCCDFFEITGIRRPKVEPCTMYEPASEFDYKKLQNEKAKLGLNPNKDIVEVLGGNSIQVRL